MAKQKAKPRARSLTKSERLAHSVLMQLQELRLLPRESYSRVSLEEIKLKSWDEKTKGLEKGYVIEERERQVWFEWGEFEGNRRVTITLRSMRCGFPDRWDDREMGFWNVTAVEIVGNIADKSANAKHPRIVFEGDGVFIFLVVK